MQSEKLHFKILLIYIIVFNRANVTHYYDTSHITISCIKFHSI